MSREWSETLTRLDISPDPTAGQSRQLGDVERTIQTLTRLAEELHEIHPQLSAEQVMSRVSSMLQKLDRIKGYSPFQWTCAHRSPVWNRGHGWHRSNHDGAKPDNQNGRSEHEFANACAPPNLESLIEAEGENTSNSNRANLCASGEFRVEGHSLDHTGMETGLDQLGFLIIIDGTTESLVHNPSLYRACPHPTSDDTRDVPSRGTLSKFEQVLQSGQVPDGVWTGLLEQEGAPAEGETRRKRVE